MPPIPHGPARRRTIVAGSQPIRDAALLVLLVLVVTSVRVTGWDAGAADPTGALATPANAAILEPAPREEPVAAHAETPADPAAADRTRRIAGRAAERAFEFVTRQVATRVDVEPSSAPEGERKVSVVFLRQGIEPRVLEIELDLDEAERFARAGLSVLEGFAGAMADEPEKPCKRKAASSHS